MSAEHQLKALDALNLIPMADNPAAEMASASEATAHALLYIGDQLAALVEQQKLANLIAVVTAGDTDAVALGDYAIDIAAEVRTRVLAVIKAGGTPA